MEHAASSAPEFTPEEWELLKGLHFEVFGLVAGSDGRIDRKERAELERQVREGGLVYDPLHRRLLRDILQDEAAWRLAPRAPNRMPTRSAKVKSALRRHLTPGQYQRFIESLFRSGLEVARASGSSRLRGGPVSREERSALTAFAVQYELDSGALRDWLGLEDRD